MHIFGVDDVSKLGFLPSAFKSGCVPLSSDVGSCLPEEKSLRFFHESLLLTPPFLLSDVKGHPTAPLTPARPPFCLGPQEAHALLPVAERLEERGTKGPVA